MRGCLQLSLSLVSQRVLNAYGLENICNSHDTNTFVTFTVAVGYRLSQIACSCPHQTATLQIALIIK